MYHYDGNGQSPNYCQQEKLAAKVVRKNAQQCPAIKNHTSVHYKNQIIIFGGYDSKKNHNDIHIYRDGQWTKYKAHGKIPESRNGHSATVVENKMFVIGGWLGSGTYASGEVYVLDLDTLTWTLVNTIGEVPGPCNMHSADLIGELIYIFRGGDGKDYLNDLHSFNAKTNIWKFIQTPEKDKPPPRANHSSTVWENKLFIFGGWDGKKRLNDLYSYDTSSNKWSELNAAYSPSARAGMCMTTMDNNIYLFGGSGPQTTCFGDLQCYDPMKNLWTIVDLQEEEHFDKARAGHSMTAMGNLIYIFGGSCGTQYFKDFFIIDTITPPNIHILDFNNIQVNNYFKQFYNSPKYSDLIFLVEDQQFYAHKLLLSRNSNFSKLFESEQQNEEQKIYIQDTSAVVFEQLLLYIYTGEQPSDQFSTCLQQVKSLLSTADQYMLVDLKSLCEKILCNFIDQNSVSQLKSFAELSNATQLYKYCDWYQTHHL